MMNCKCIYLKIVVVVLLLLLLIIIIIVRATNDDKAVIFDVPVSPVWGWQGIPVRNLNAALNTVERN